MTVLVVGGSGFLGAELARQGHAAGRQTAATFHSHPGEIDGVTWHRLDLSNPASAREILDAVSPTAVVNASSGGSQWAVTAEGGMRLAQAAAQRGIRLVHVSSDAVFSGRRHDQYDETCLPDPVTPYGAAKAAAETAVRLLDEGAVVARTSLIIGDGRSEHERMVHALVAGTRDGALFTDESGAPSMLAIWPPHCGSSPCPMRLVSFTSPARTPSLATNSAPSLHSETALTHRCCGPPIAPAVASLAHSASTSTAASPRSTSPPASAEPGSSSDAKAPTTEPRHCASSHRPP
ncbi:hypothetical protein J2S50_007444 [Streptomyces sp. DSM 40167]|nr:hypothetical protein [Streptomyces sp. DSM 40167]